jgi:outer membrane protein OmpA-like peptidoglycan-associated protein
MRFTTDILTSLTAFWLFGSGSDRTGREKQVQQADDREVHYVGTPDKATGARSKALRAAALPKGRLLFASNSLKLPARNRKSLECATAWLRQHPEDRVLIVGYCDDSGSEACTAALAQRRAEVVQQFLLSLGTRTEQIAGIKGWENLNGLCRAGVTECQRQNRSARLFVAEPEGSLK